MGYAGPKAISKVNMILKDKSCGLPKLNLGNPLKKSKVKPGQEPLDADNDGFLTGSDFEKLGSKSKGGMKKYGDNLLKKKGCKKKYRK